jgi:peroxiredoxin Q/BCP
MTDVVAGARAPAFHLPSTDGDASLDGLLAGGKRLVLAFFFEAGTPTCESEVAMLKDAHEMFADLNANVLAVSADTLEAQAAFAKRLGGVPFPLASDTALDATRAYGVVDEGDPRRSRRAAFVIGSDGSVVLAVPHLQPSNVSQVEAIIEALGRNTTA